MSDLRNLLSLSLSLEGNELGFGSVEYLLPRLTNIHNFISLSLNLSNNKIE